MADLDSRGECLGRELEADGAVELVEPRARGVDDGNVGADDRAAREADARALGAVGGRLKGLDALVEANLDVVASARAQEVLEAG